MIATTAAICTGAAAIGMLNPKPPRKPLTDAEKEYIIAQALQTPEGKTALALAMCEPIRARLDYQGVGRKLLFA